MRARSLLTFAFWLSFSYLGANASSEAHEPLAPERLPMLRSGTSLELTVSEPAGAYMLVDADSGEVLASANPHEPLIPASLTKVMTLRLVFKALAEGKIAKNDVVPVSVRAWGYRRPLRGTSLMFLQPGMPVTIDQLIEGMSVASANDASVALAEHIGGSLAAFVEMMNEEAAELGLTSARFHDPHGLSPKNRISAADMARLAMSMMREFPEYIDYANRTWMTYNNIKQRNHLFRLFRQVEGANGMKTGYTSKAGYSIVASAERGERRLLTVVMGMPRRVDGKRGSYSRDRLAASLFEAGFAAPSQVAAN